MKKGTIFILLAAMLFTGIFGQSIPVKAANVAQTDTYLKVAEAAARKLAPQLTYKGNTALKDVDLPLFIQTRDNLIKTKTALKTLSSTNQQKFALRVNYVQTVYDRAVAFRAAVYHSKVITNSKNSFISKYKRLQLSSDTEKAYNDLVKRTNETQTIFNKVYDNLARATFLSKYLKPAQAAVDPYVQTMLPLKQEITSVTNDIVSLEKAVETNQPQATLDRLHSTIQQKLSNLNHPETVAQINGRLQKVQEGYKILSERSFPEWSVSQMVLDETKGYLYLLSRRENKLYVVSSKDLRIVKELQIGKPKHMEMYEGKLYVAANPSVIVDLESLTTKPISTPLPKINIFKIYEDHMYYATDGPETLSKFNLNTGIVTEVIKEGGSIRDYSFRVDQMELDKGHGVLYIRDSTHIKAINLNTYDILSQDNYADGYGFSYNGKLYYDRGSVFYYRYRFDANDLTTIHGRYFNNDYHHEVILVRDRFVYTSRVVFDRETYRMIRKLPIQSDLMLLDSSNNMYSYYYNKLTKLKVNVLPVDTRDFQQSGNQIKMDQEMTDWVYDEANEKIYAISKFTNKLFVIDAKTYIVEKSIFIGSYPIDIELHNGKIYVALYGASKIAVLPAKADGPITHIKTNMIPGQIAVDDKAIYYTDVIGSHQFRPLYMYSFATGETINFLKQLKSSIEYQAHAWNYKRIKLDPHRPILYINDNDGQMIYAVNTDDLEVVDQSIRESFEIQNGADMFVDQDNFYNVFYVTKKDDLKAHQVKFEQPVVYVGNQYIFTMGMIYKKESFDKIGLFKENIHSAYINSRDEVFLLNEEKKVLSKFDSIDQVVQIPHP